MRLEGHFACVPLVVRGIQISTVMGLEGGKVCVVAWCAHTYERLFTSRLPHCELSLMMIGTHSIRPRMGHYACATRRLQSHKRVPETQCVTTELSNHCLIMTMPDNGQQDHDNDFSAITHHRRVHTVLADIWSADVRAHTMP